MRVVMRGYRVGGDLIPGISQDEVRPIRSRSLRNRELVVEAGQPCSPAQRELPTGDRGNIEIGYLVETTREQPSRRIVGQRLTLGTGRESDEEDKAPRSRRRGGRTQRHGIHSPSESPKLSSQQRTEPYPPASAILPRPNDYSRTPALRNQWRSLPQSQPELGRSAREQARRPEVGCFSVTEYPQLNRHQPEGLRR